uniref:Bm468 n=2 Tax=Brugia TaxID=6278 RepID=A0A1I9GDI9_BRUMA|nr:Bm468 [Brugia malayi]
MAHKTLKLFPCIPIYSKVWINSKDYRLVNEWVDEDRSAGDTVRFRPALLRFVSTHKCTKYSELLMKDAGELIVSNDSSTNFSYDYYEI